MSETTLCQQYKEYCASANIHYGGGYSDDASAMIQVSSKIVEDGINSLAKASSRIANLANSTVKYGTDATSKMVMEVGKELSSINARVMTALKDGKYGASRIASAMLGGILEEPFNNSFYGGSTTDPVITHSEYMLGSYDFVSGAGEEVLESLKARITIFESYLTILANMLKHSTELKDKDELKMAVREQYEFVKKAVEEFKRISTRLGKSSDVTKKLEALASSGKLAEIKELLKTNHVDKEMVDNYIALLRLQGPTLMRAEELKRALETIGMTLSEFHKLGNMKTVDEVLSKYEAKLHSKTGKDQMKYLEAIRQIRDMAYSQSVGEKFDGAGCGCSVAEYVPEVQPEDYFGGKKCVVSENYFGGDFLGLEREVDYEFTAESQLSLYDVAKKTFLREQAKVIAKMMEAAQKAAMDFSGKVDVGDDNVMLFLRRLEALKMVDEATLLETFATYGKNYNSKYVKEQIVSELSDLVAYAKKLESVVGPSMSKFADAIDDYRKFLEQAYKQSHESSKMLGGSVNCSGINASSVYDRFEFVGGYMELSIANIVDVFKKSILLGNMQNGLNLGLQELKDYSIEQDKMNSSVLAKEANDLELSAVEMISKYQELETFPIKKPIFETALRNNIHGQVNLLHAAQAMEKKLRSYTEEIIHNPTAATAIADLLAKVSVDLNWLADPDFVHMKEFCDYFHIEAVAKNGLKYKVGAKNVGDSNGEVNIGTQCSTAANPTPINADGTTVNNIAKIDYIKESKLTPLPIRIQDCINPYVSTLVTATEDGKFGDPAGMRKALRVKNGTAPTGTRVNYYDGRSILPSRKLETYDVIDITSPNEHVTDVKFLDQAVIMRNYNSAIIALREGADRILNLRNLFSIFEHIDDAYKKSKNIDDGVKIGQIYGAIKEYLILTSIYPIIYKDGEKYTCGFLGMRHFGHDIVTPFEADGFELRLPTGELLTDLGVMGRSLKEFYEGLDVKHEDLPAVGATRRAVNPKTGFSYDPYPGNKDYTIDTSAGYTWLKDQNYPKAFEHAFKARYARFDLLFTAIIKSMFAKIMSVLAMYNLINFNGRSGTAPTDNLGFAQLRTIYGGDSVMNEGFYSLTPEVKPECAELYVRLYYYVIFYKRLFLEEDPQDKHIIEQVAALKRFALLPVEGSKYTALLKIFFLKNFEKTTPDKVSISDPDLIAYINECNKLWDAETGTPRVRFDKIIKDFIRDINRRYGLVKTDNFKDVMNKRFSKQYPGVAKMKSKEEYHSEDFKMKQRIYNKPELLDGEDDPIGNLGAPSAKNESVLPVLTKATTLIRPTKDNYKVEELLSAVYAFRTKLDRYTEEITKNFNNMDKYSDKGAGSATSAFSNSLNHKILMLKTKLGLRSSNLDRFRIIKEYMMDVNNNKLFNIAPEVMLYRELVLNNANLLYKIYTRLIANIRIHGIDNEYTDPLLRGTFLYYLDSVNTDLVTVNRLGKAPVLDFSTLQAVMDKHLSQTRELHLMLRSGIDDSYAKKMDKILTTLVNAHRAIFVDGGMISKIKYEDAGSAKGVLLYPTNDYSEYQHMTPINHPAVGENNFIFDVNPSRYPNSLILNDPRINILRGKNFTAPSLEFELLSQDFSPKNIYVLFEFLLALMYKVFYEKHGVWYGPLLDGFIDQTSGINFDFDIVSDTNTELGGAERFNADMPFSDKMLALYKTIYKFALRKDTLVQNDITLIPESLKSDMKRYIPLFLFLFKFIIKQAYLHAGMLADDNVVKTTTSDLIGPKTGGDNPFMANHSAFEITGGATDQEVRAFRESIDDYITAVESYQKISEKCKKLPSKIKGLATNDLLGATIDEDESVNKSGINAQEVILDLKKAKSSDNVNEIRQIYDKFMLLDKTKAFQTINLSKFDNTGMLKTMLEHYPVSEVGALSDDLYVAGTLAPSSAHIIPVGYTNYKPLSYSYDFDSEDKSAVNLMAFIYGANSEELFDKSMNVVANLISYQEGSVDSYKFSALNSRKDYKDIIAAYKRATELYQELYVEYGKHEVLFELCESVTKVVNIADEGELAVHKTLVSLLRDSCGGGELNDIVRNFTTIAAKTIPAYKKNDGTPGTHRGAVYTVPAIDAGAILADLGAYAPAAIDAAAANLALGNTRAVLEPLLRIAEGAPGFITVVGGKIADIKNEIDDYHIKDKQNKGIYYSDPNFSILVRKCKDYANELFPECKNKNTKRFHVTPDAQELVKNLSGSKLGLWKDFHSWFSSNYIAVDTKAQKYQRDALNNIHVIIDEYYNDLANIIELIRKLNNYNSGKIGATAYFAEPNTKAYKDGKGKITEYIQKIGKEPNYVKKTDIVYKCLNLLADMIAGLSATTDFTAGQFTSAINADPAAAEVAKRADKAARGTPDTGVREAKNLLQLIGKYRRAAGDMTLGDILSRFIAETRRSLANIDDGLNRFKNIARDEYERAAEKYVNDFITRVNEVNTQFMRIYGTYAAYNDNSRNKAKKAVYNGVPLSDIPSYNNNADAQCKPPQLNEDINRYNVRLKITVVHYGLEDTGGGQITGADYRDIFKEYINGARDPSLTPIAAVDAVDVDPLIDNLINHHEDLLMEFAGPGAAKVMEYTKKYIQYLLNNLFIVGDNVAKVSLKDGGIIRRPNADVDNADFTHYNIDIGNAYSNPLVAVAAVPARRNGIVARTTNEFITGLKAHVNMLINTLETNFHAIAPVQNVITAISDSIMNTLNGHTKFITLSINNANIITRKMVNVSIGRSDITTIRTELDDGITDVNDGRNADVLAGVAAFTGGNEFIGGEVNVFIEKIITLLEQVTDLNREFTIKKLHKYADRLKNMSSINPEYIALYVELAKFNKLSTKTEINNLIKIASKLSDVKSEVKLTPVSKISKELFPVRSLFSGASFPSSLSLAFNTEKTNGPSNIFGNIQNNTLVEAVGMIDSSMSEYFVSSNAIKKLRYLQSTKSSYDDVISMLSDSVVTNFDGHKADVGGKLFTKHNAATTAFCKLNMLLQSFLLNDHIKLDKSDRLEFGISGDDLLDLIHIMKSIISTGTTSAAVNELLSKISKYNDGNDLGEFTKSLAVTQLNEFTGGAYEGDYYKRYADFCGKYGIDTGIITSEKFARGAKLYESLKKYLSDEEEALSIVAYYLHGHTDASIRNIINDVCRSIGDIQIQNIVAKANKFTRSTGKNVRPLRNYSSKDRANLQANPDINDDKDYQFKRNGFNRSYIKNDGSFDDPGNGDPFCREFGVVIDKNSMIARAKNAVKYATLIYKSLHKVLTSIGDKPRYMNPAPYIGDVYEIVGKEQVLAPTSIAVDLIPTFVNTYTGSGLAVQEANIITDVDTIKDRKTYGLHCNNIADIISMFSGSKSILLENVTIFLTDDRLHKITIDDFPSLKSIIDKSALSEVARPNLSLNSMNSYISEFGRLTKYLYELEFKGAFADTFPVFNSLTAPKYFASLECRITGLHTLEYSEKQELSKCFLSSLAITTLIDDSKFFTKSSKELIFDMNIGEAGKPNGLGYLGDLHMIDNDSLVTMIELNSNTKEMSDYITKGGEIKNYGSGAGRTTTISELTLRNIVDVGIMPININSMMREIPLASLMNGVYSFDVIVDWLIHEDRYVKSTNPVPQRFTVGSNRIITPDTAAAIPVDDTRIDSTRFYKNPLNRRIIPISDSDKFLNLNGCKFGNNADIVQPRSKVTSKSDDAAPTNNSALVKPMTPHNNQYMFLPIADLNCNSVIASTVVKYDNKLYYIDGDINKPSGVSINYNHFRSFITSTSVQILNEGAVKLTQPDMGTLIGKLETLKTLTKPVDVPTNVVLVNDIDGSFSSANSDEIAINDGFRNTYYHNQTTYDIKVKDIYHGVDPDLRNPILAANIYSELLLNLFNKEFKARYEQTNRISRNPSTIVKGVSSLYQKYTH